MSSDWPEFQLGERCTVKSSKRIFANEYVDNGIPFMRSKDVIDKALGSFVDYDLYISEERFSEIKRTHGSPVQGDLLMSSVGNRSGQPYVIQNEGDFHFKDGNILWLSEFTDINPDYLAYWFKSTVGQNALVSVMIGSAQKALTIDSIRKLWVKFPSIEYQNKAATILMSLDKKIKLNRQTNGTLERVAQTIFKSWFVDFEPTRAKVAAKEAGQDPERAAMSAISGKALEELDHLSVEQLKQLKMTAALFPNEMITSKLGEVPSGWKVTLLGDVTKELRRGISPKYTEEKGIQIINQKCIRNHSINFELTRLNDPEKRKVEGRLIELGDILINSTGVGTLGRLAPVRFLPEPTVFDNHVTVVRADENKISKAFLCGLMMDKESFIEASGAGSTGQTELRKQVLQEMVFAKPRLILGRKFEAIFEPINQQIATLEIEQECLSEIRDALLPKLLSGELEIPTKKTEIA